MIPIVINGGKLVTAPESGLNPNHKPIPRDQRDDADFKQDGYEFPALVVRERWTKGKL